MAESQRKVEILYKGRMQDVDRSVDVKFWQQLGSRAIFDAAWEMVEEAWKLKGRDLDELRLQRSVVHIQRGRG